MSHVIVVAPDTRDQEVIKRALNKLGVNTTNCYSVWHEGVRAMRALAADAFILDVLNIPERGRFVVEQIRSRPEFEETKIFLMIEPGILEEPSWLNRFSNTGVIRKPLNFESLQHAFVPSSLSKPKESKKNPARSNDALDVSFDFNSTLNSFILERENAISNDRENHTQQDSNKMSGAPKAILNSALVIEKDPGFATFLESALRDVGARYIEVLQNADSAWTRMAQYSFDLVVLDWKIQDPSGLTIYNRIRSHRKLKRQPILIVCGRVSKEDFRVVDFHTSTEILEKPFLVPAFRIAIEKLFGLHNEISTIQEKVNSIVEKNPPGAENTNHSLSEILQISKKPNIAMVIAGETYLEKGRLKEAEAAFKTALKIDSKNPAIMTGLGRALHRQKRTDEAYKIVSVAQSLSPNNADRLCSLGEIGLAFVNADQAKDFFSQALHIDAKNETASAGLLLAQNLKECSSEFSAMSKNQPKQLSSILNLVGISLVRNKQYAKGIEQYLAAIQFAHTQLELARLQFNLALAYLRSSDFVKAKQWFEKASEAGGKQFTKPSEFLKKFGPVLSGEKSDDRSVLAATSNIENELLDDETNTSSPTPTKIAL